MSDRKNSDDHFHPDETGILKSTTSGPQRMSEFMNSAVSESAVSRAEIEVQKNQVYVGATPAAVPNEVFVGQTPEAPKPEEKKVEALQETLAKANALVESFEQRQAKLTEVYDQAEKMLEEVSRIKEALTFDNKLRERIEATIARTKNLRRGVKR
jgi:DNA-directed RNA polymerase specialized sigma54-like protein